MRRIGKTIVTATVILVLVSCSKSDPSDPGGNRDECGDIKAAISPIINGVDHPEVVELTDGQMRAIGFLSLDFSGGCSATIVAPTVVLAAAHCVEHSGPGSTILFVVGENYMSPERTIRASAWHMHPSYRGSSGGMGSPEYDISVIILEEDATVYDISPIPVNLVHTMLAGQTIQAVGYGVTRPSGGWNSRRWWTTVPVVHEQPLWYVIDGGGVTGVCSGDSGGPMLYDIPGRGVHVMGVVSSGDLGCVGLTYYPRTDAFEDWLLDFIDLGPCGWETLEGRCDGDTAIWCEGETVLTHDCASFGWICGADADGNSRCVEPPPPCGDETLTGRCDGETAIWCEDDSIFYHDCASFDYWCGLNGDGLYRCVNDSCRGETIRGRCDGNTAVWCEDGSVLYQDCTEFEYVCGSDAEGNYRCIPSDSSECDILGHHGECVERDGRSFARWCDHGEIKERDCTCDGGRVCGWAGPSLGFYCI